MSDEHCIATLGSRERIDRLQLVASRLAAEFGTNAELYAEVRAHTAEQLGAVQRSRSWRVVQGILRRK